MVDELLLIARRENRQLALQHAPFELTQLVDELKEITEAMAVGQDLAIRVEPALPIWALGDAGRTRHVLLNLASNAVRYTRNRHLRCAAAGFGRGGERAGLGSRDSSPAPRLHLRSLLPDRAIPEPGARRHRARDRAAPGAAPRGRGHGGKQTGRGKQVHRLVA